MNTYTSHGLRATALTFAILASSSVLAGGPIADCQPGQPFVWGSGGSNIPFNPDQGDLGPLSNAAAVTAVNDAFAVWQATATSSATYSNNGLLPVDVDISNFSPYLNAAAPDGLSAIVFDDTGAIFDLLFGPGSGILGFAGPEWGTPATCTITEGLSFLNGPSFVDPTAALDVMVHEFGHYSGLGHTVVNGQLFIGAGDTSGAGTDDPYGIPDPSAEPIETMYPFYFGPNTGTQNLNQDDMASLSTLYPDASFVTTGKISGKILLANGVIPVTGVNVIARNDANPFYDAVSAISGDFGVDGEYQIEGLTPGANYRVYIDQILAGGFSTVLSGPFPGPEEYYNLTESNNLDSADPVSAFDFVQPNSSDVDIIFNAPAPGDPLLVGDDGSVNLALPFSFELCGMAFSSVSVNANGNLTFGAPNGDFSESSAEMLSGPPRIAGWWDDLNPANGGTVSYQQSKNSFTVSWDSVPEYFSSGANSFSINLRRANNGIDIEYGDMTSLDALVGVSCGATVTSGMEGTSDLSEYNGRINLHNSPAKFELFYAVNGNDLANSQLRFNGTTTFNDNWAGKNNSFRKARSLNLPFSSADVGRFTEIEPIGNDIDWYRFETKGDKALSIEITAGPLDSLIALFDNSGNLIITDDDGGSGILSKILALDLPAGRYYLAVTTFADLDLIGAGSSGGRYVLEIDESNNVPLTMGDDNSIELPLGFTFSFNGVDYTTAFVNSNGNMTFGTGDTDFSESIGELLSDQPRIAPLWDDLSPNNGGNVSYAQEAGSFILNFDSVPEFVSTGANSFTLTLRADGSYTIEYGAISALDGLAGSSPGGGVTDPGASDLNALGNFLASGTHYELFDAVNPNDLSGVVLEFTP
ncbi:pre-peptidase C-terminal domain-containing protein [uncultured Paraglaciecola sp.]|uniref:pre-peptidase C-terminal domain-containing protein n=1 Tax=uncultured Paraglaciecola sp. TaxID=1765024 RepID=UPI00260DE9D1|nr:pre-peptidase C-terminal domain-containing protein [uncultured Paraglaciecola sp.]